MMFKRVSTLLSACALAGVMVAMTGTTAQAAPLVVFSTTGSFNGAGNTITFGGNAGDPNTFTLTFNGTTILPPGLDTPTYTSLGDLQFSVVGEYSGAASASFDLNISQTVPTIGTGTVSGTLTGNIAKLNQSTFLLSFTSPSTTIGDVTYLVTPTTYPIVPTVSGCGGGATCGNTSIQAYISAVDQTPVPEPATMMLLGTGLLAAFRARRKTA